MGPSQFTARIAMSWTSKQAANDAAAFAHTTTTHLRAMTMMVSSDRYAPGWLSSFCTVPTCAGSHGVLVQRAAHELAEAGCVFGALEGEGDTLVLDTVGFNDRFINDQCPRWR